MSSFASLHSGLIARKGEAAPANRHAHLSYIDDEHPARLSHSHSSARSQIGPKPSSASSPVIATFAAKPAHTSAEVPQPAAESAKTAPAKLHMVKRSEQRHGHYQLTFRMTGDQRRRLRLVAAQQDKSLQAILAEALDNHLDGLCACSMSSCACLARQKEPAQGDLF